LLIATLRRMRASDLPFRRFYEIGSCQKMFSRTESSYSPYKGLGGKIAPVSTTYAVAGCSIFNSRLFSAHRTQRGSRWSERPVLFALFLLSRSCERKPLLLLLLKSCPGQGISSRSRSGSALARRPIMDEGAGC
jgi:hypothetical protein